MTQSSPTQTVGIFRNFSPAFQPESQIHPREAESNVSPSATGACLESRVLQCEANYCSLLIHSPLKPSREG